MRRWSVVFTAGALLLAGCAASGPRVQTGPEAVMSPDGLHRVDGVVVGTLFMKPDYAFGSYKEFALGGTDVTFAQGSRVVEGEELSELVAIFEEVAREAIASTGRAEVERPQTCVAYVKLALVDLELEAGGGAASLGAVTLVLEIRDGHTMEALLRYGQRRRLAGVNLSAAFKRYATRFQLDFERSLPRPDPATTLTCAQRAAESS
jgi:hypothetical protein